MNDGNCNGEINKLANGDDSNKNEYNPSSNDFWCAKEVGKEDNDGQLETTSDKW